MNIDIERVKERLKAMYEAESAEQTEDAVSSKELYIGWAKKLGLKVKEDASGSIVIRLQGRDPYLPSIVMSSRLDQVLDGGKYDGALGCIGALEVCETLLEDDYVPEHPIEIVIFTNQGSCRDTIREPESVHCLIELHADQGRILDRNNIPVGIVSSGAGICRYQVTVDGTPGHAGTTAMEERKDALVASAAFISRLPALVKEEGEAETLATVGKISVEPDLVNIIPSRCKFSLEFRDQTNELIDRMKEKAEGLLQKICEEWKVSYEIEHISSNYPGKMCGWVKTTIKKAAEKLDYEYKIMSSGASYDALTLAEEVSTGMIFVPGAGEECDTAEESVKGCNVLLQTVLDIDNMSR